MRCNVVGRQACPALADDHFRMGGVAQHRKGLPRREGNTEDPGDIGPGYTPVGKHSNGAGIGVRDHLVDDGGESLSSLGEGLAGLPARLVETGSVDALEMLRVGRFRLGTRHPFPLAEVHLLEGFVDGDLSALGIGDRSRRLVSPR